MRLRAEYYVDSNLRFLSNLDMKRMMERSLRRSGLKYALSSGFNPQIKLSMGTVLPVGVWGENEYFDIELQADINPADFITIMNEVLPPGVRVKRCIVIKAETKALMKVVNAASYGFIIKKGGLTDNLPERLLAGDTLIVKSRGKQKNLDKDLRPGIFNIEVQVEPDFDMLKLWVAVGEPLNVRYDELLDLLIAYNIDNNDIIDVYRGGNYIKIKENFYSPVEKVI